MVLPIGLTSLEGLDVAVVVFWVTQMYDGVTRRYDQESHAKKVPLVCPSYWDAISTRCFKFWVTWMYDVAVAVKFVRLDCLSAFVVCRGQSHQHGIDNVDRPGNFLHGDS